ncbi:mucin-5AC [Vespula pensylvanica]|uniref:Uncharacterized protein n=1 Tax=Vespula pensylvanica TaxID=30213 RepID=A0A834JQA4_VESPE|nr:mucin-5AC [Vespula pensylvanica]KAF7389551.1 hypothetical protein H0235_018035 [Vespula pensylvanica]
MYSLYRAWFGDESAADNYNRLQETLSPPDTVIRVGNEGEHQFIAHKGILAAHSGYLKALLASAAASSSSGPNFGGSCGGLNSASSSNSTTTGIGGQHTRQPVTSVSVSSIGGEAFAPLLNYMYTGRLEVTLDNVYSVLLATHLLHMPGALEQCRAALLRLRGPPPLPTPIPITPTSTSTSTSSSGPGNILRPIPNRLVLGPPLCWPQTSSIYPSTATAPGSVGLTPHLPQMQPTTVLIPPSVSPNVSVIPTLTSQETQEPNTHYSSSNRDISRSPRSSPSRLNKRTINVVKSRSHSRSTTPDTISPTSSLPYVNAAAAAFNAFASRSSSPSVASRSSSLSRSPSPTSRRGKKTNPIDRREITNSKQELRTTTTTDIISTGQTGRSNENTNSIVGSPTRINNSDNPKCSTMSTTTTTTDVDRGRPPSHRRKNRIANNNSSNNVNDPSSSSSSGSVLSVVYDVACCDGPVKFHRVLNENYTVPQSRLQRHCIDDNTRPPPPIENDENGGSGTTRVRNCPTDPIITTQTTDSGNNVGSYSCGYCRHTFKSQYCYRKHAKRHLLPTRSNGDTTAPIERNRQDNNSRNKREVRLLDLNVQYYPCKICGCKFPSYYFVHKHRKLCHANVDDNTRVNNRDDVVTFNDQESTSQPVDDTTPQRE